MNLDVLVSGYPSMDHIIPVSRAPRPGETGVLLQPPRLDVPTLGGCPNNIAVACARLGLAAAPVIVVGDDADGERMTAVLQRENVDTHSIQVVPGGHTAHTFLFVDPDNRHQTFYYPGVSDREDMPLCLPKYACWGVITVGNAVHNTAVLDWLTTNNIPVLWSHKNDARAFPETLVRRLANISRILVMNQYEADSIQVMLHLSSLNDLFANELRAIIVTHGAQGCHIIESGNTTDVPVVSPGQVVDPTGAGDAFTAGVLFGLRQHMSLETSAQVGSVVASFVLEAWGCQTNLPTLAQVQKRYRQAYGKALKVMGKH